MNNALPEVDQHAARSLAYRFLAGIYLQKPDPAWLAGLASEGMLEDFVLPVSNPALEQGLGLMASDCAALAADPHGCQARALDEEYTRLFVGPGSLPAPPWESVYRTEERLLFDWPTLEVRQAYQQVGLAVSRPGEPDDHIGLELLFMALLCERAAAGDEAAAEAQRRFLQEHLLQWAPVFASDLARHARTDLYRGLAHATIGILAMDQDPRL